MSQSDKIVKQIKKATRRKFTAEDNSYVEVREKTPAIKYILLMSISFFIKLIMTMIMMNNSIYDLGVVLVDVIFTGIFVYGASLWTLTKGYDGFHSMGSFIPFLFIPTMFFAPIKEVNKKTRWDTALTILAILGSLRALIYVMLLSRLMHRQ